MRGLHHIHLRKRVSKNLEPFPARTVWKRFLDQLVIVVGVIGPVASIPQILKIYLSQDATGISIVSFGVWALLDIPWILYGLAHREKPIVLMYSLWLLVNISIVTGAVLYGNRLF